MKKKSTSAISDRIIEVMRDRKYRTITELAAAVGMTYGTLANYTNGTIPKHEFFLAMAKIGVDMNWLVTGEGDMNLAQSRTGNIKINNQTGVNHVVANTGTHNGNIVAGVHGSSHHDGVQGGARLLEWLQDYMNNNSEQAQRNLNIRMQRAFPEFEMWLAENSDE